MAYARFRTEAVIFEPVIPGTVPNNSIFADSSNLDQFTNKNTIGTPLPVQDPNVLFRKLMQSGGAIPPGKPVSKKPDGKIIVADSDAVAAQQVIGISIDDFPSNNSLGYIHLFAPNVAGVLTSLGFAPGDEIYLSEIGGYINNAASYTGDNDSIIKIGVADCPAGVASATATDLIIFPSVIARPI